MLSQEGLHWRGSARGAAEPLLLRGTASPTTRASATNAAHCSDHAVVSMTMGMHRIANSLAYRSTGALAGAKRTAEAACGAVDAAVDALCAQLARNEEGCVPPAVCLGLVTGVGGATKSAG